MIIKILLSLFFFWMAARCSGWMDIIKSRWPRSIFEEPRYKSKEPNWTGWPTVWWKAVLFYMCGLFKPKAGEGVSFKIAFPNTWKWIEGDWKNHYIDGNPAKGVRPLLPYRWVRWLDTWQGTKYWKFVGWLTHVPQPAPLWDAWHFCKFMLLVWVYAAIAVWFPVGLLWKLLIGLLFAAGWGFGFNIVFEVNGQRKDVRRNYWKSMWDFRKKS